MPSSSDYVGGALSVAHVDKEEDRGRIGTHLTRKQNSD
jgi:hypothetical protein